jgi:hypothetical protein
MPELFRPFLHHPILLQPFNGFEGYAGVMEWGAR